jgi:hypothetical protein
MSFKKIAWVFDAPYFNLKDPNLRIKNLIHTRFNLMGWDSRVVLPQDVMKDRYDAAIFCSVDATTLNLVTRLKQVGTKTLFHHMESIFGFPLQKEIFSSVDGVVCVSANLAYATETIHKLGNCYHIDDPADDVFFSMPETPKKEKMTVVYSGGMPGLAELYRPHIEKAGWDLLVIGYPNDGRDYFREPDDFGGNPYWWVQEYRSCHASLCAHDFVGGVNKSVIKVVTSWANGLIPIASPIPSYRAVIDHGMNGFIYHDFESVGSILKNLKDFEALKENGRKKAELFSSDAISKKWAVLIRNL